MMFPNKQSYDMKKCRKYLTHSFSKNEIEIICFDLGVDPEEFREQKSMFVVDFLNWLLRKGKMHLLNQWLTEEGYTALLNTSDDSPSGEDDVGGGLLKCNCPHDATRWFISETHHTFGGEIIPAELQELITDFDIDSEDQPYKAESDIYAN